MGNKIKEQLETYKKALRNPKATQEEKYNAYDFVKNLIDDKVEEEYIKNIFYERFISLKTYKMIGISCGGISDECARKIVERYINKLEGIKKVKQKCPKCGYENF